MYQALLNSDLVFWLAWILIPLVVEIIPAIGSFILLLFKKRFTKKGLEPSLYPEITILIPVYNSSETLEKCIRSIDTSKYPNELITVLLIDNGSSDTSFDIFQSCQLKYDLYIQWLQSNQGKSKALNKGLFNSRGKYIINVDSDGRFEENAITNIVERFENDMDLQCLTGVILTETEEIKETEGWFLRQIRKLEFMEYCQAFLVGRNFSSSMNSIYTVSGAFTAFKKSAILTSFLYNSNTLCEDAHITFQFKRKGLKVELCEDAVFYVSPIDNMNKLYTQRQRWQIGELEVFHMFYQKKLQLRNMIKDKDFKVLLTDHTFAFPRMIWYFALLGLSTISYDLVTVLLAMLLIYGMYIFTGFLFAINVNSYLKKFPDDRKYYNRIILYTIIYPMYHLYVFVLRFMGIVNSIGRSTSWKTFTFRDEMNIIKNIVKKDFSFSNKESGEKEC